MGSKSARNRKSIDCDFHRRVVCSPSTFSPLSDADFRWVYLHTSFLYLLELELTQKKKRYCKLRMHYEYPRSYYTQPLFVDVVVPETKLAYVCIMNIWRVWKLLQLKS